MIHRAAVATALALLFVSACGCSNLCDTITVADPVITITDAVTGQRICDATVQARCAFLDAARDMLVSGGAGGCDYGPALESICNVSTLTISKPGYEPATVARVEIRNATGCNHVAPAPQQVHVTLKPE